MVLTTTEIWVPPLKIFGNLTLILHIRYFYSNWCSILQNILWFSKIFQNFFFYGSMTSSSSDESASNEVGLPSSGESSDFCLRHFALRFWNHVLTCLSDKSNFLANFRRSYKLEFDLEFEFNRFSLTFGLRYFSVSKRASSEFVCSVVNRTWPPFLLDFGQNAFHGGTKICNQLLFVMCNQLLVTIDLLLLFHASASGFSSIVGPASEIKLSWFWKFSMRV